MNQAKQIIAEQLSQSLTVIELVGLMWAGGLSKLLLSTKPITLRLIVGELLLSVPAGVLISSVGSIKGLSPAWVMIMGSVVSLVGIDMLARWLKKHFEKYMDRV